MKENSIPIRDPDYLGPLITWDRGTRRPYIKKIEFGEDHWNDKNFKHTKEALIELVENYGTERGGIKRTLP